MFKGKDIRPPVDELNRALTTRWEDFTVEYKTDDPGPILIIYTDKKTGFQFCTRMGEMWCESDYFDFSDDEYYMILKTISQMKEIKKDQNRYKWTGVL